jgi:predicted RNA-binding protein with EMAP domain
MKSFRRKEISENLEKFLSEISTCVYTALNPEAIKKGFRLARVCNDNNDTIELEKNIKEYLQEFPESYSNDLPVYIYLI